MASTRSRTSSSGDAAAAAATGVGAAGPVDVADALISAGSAPRRQIGPAVVDELDDVRERREVAQLELVVARDVVGLPHRREGLGLLHGVDAEVGLEVEVELEHVGGIAGLLGDDGEHTRFDRVGPPRPAPGQQRAAAGVGATAAAGAGAALRWRGDVLGSRGAVLILHAQRAGDDLELRVRLAAHAGEPR